MREKINNTKHKKIRKFKVGDLAVYPAHGVGRIEAIESREVNDEKYDVYIMKVIENKMVYHDPHPECRIRQIKRRH